MKSKRWIQPYIKEISGKTWHRQGGALSIYFTAVLWWIFLRLFDGCTYYRGQNGYGYCGREKERLLVSKILAVQRKNRKYVDFLISKWRQKKFKENVFFRRLDYIDFSVLPGQKIFDLHQAFIALRSSLWRDVRCIEALDTWGDYFLEKELGKFKSAGGKLGDIFNLTRPAEISYLDREKRELLGLALDIRKYKVNPRIIRPDDQWGRKIMKHQHKWHYIHNTWWHVEKLPYSFFLGEINKSLKNIKKTKEEYERLKRPFIYTKRKVPPELDRILYFFRRVSAWRNERKEQMQIANHYDQKFLAELSHRANLSLDTLKFVNPTEMKKWPLTLAFLKTVKKREKTGNMLINYHGQPRWVYGSDAERIRRALDATLMTRELKGQPAYLGQARGRVKIIITKEDFKKMKKGDILVTQMTRPEFLPILPLAAAIVTDEGGITCHAAIISRELKIPCVIGTKTATSVLKNGDRVEVDAKQGLVKILKK